MPNTNQTLKIIFIGTPEFGAIILEKLIKSSHKPFLVITETDKPVGRKQTITPPPVKVLAEKYNIPVAQPEKIADFASDIKNLKPDLGIIAAYGQILSKEILSIPQYGFLNVHPSLLPRYRGSSPIQYTILNGDEKTGATIIRISEKMDAGPILAQKEIAISPKETFESLHDKLAELGAELLVESLAKLSVGKLPPQPQDEADVTYTKILKKDDGKIDWQKPAKEIDRQIRALNPWPGTYTIYNGKRLKILKADELGGRLTIQEVQLEGKNPTSFEDFFRGHPDFKPC
ncbi:MAG: methionyl-tRNA formyltransferase [bacterium]|nr:methionyl-tRNA formyltransferase [bacterium]